MGSNWDAILIYKDETAVVRVLYPVLSPVLSAILTRVGF